MSLLWSSSASAGLICELLGCNDGGGGSVPEIDAGAALSAIALLVAVSAVAYRKMRG
jgi:hypothetical protein